MIKFMAIFTLLCLFSCATYRPRIAPPAMAFVSGAAWGLPESTAHHWEDFRKAFPKANARYWNPSESWRNKYRNGAPEQGRNGVPLWMTDAKHMLASGNQVLLFGAGATITLGNRRPLWHYAADVGISFAAYTIGNQLTYNWIYGK